MSATSATLRGASDLPDATILLDFMLTGLLTYARTASVTRNMKRNCSRPSIDCFPAIAPGARRQAWDAMAYRRSSTRYEILANGDSFRELVASDPASRNSASRLDRVFDPQYYRQ